MSNLKRKFDSNEEIPSMIDRSKILDRKLSSRPDRHQLIEQRILFDSQCAPRLQHVEQALKRARLVDQLNNRLSNRPGPIDLIEKNILFVQQSNEDSSNKSERMKSSCRPLIFHEYTSSPTTSKPKITKLETSISSPSKSHRIRLAQQQLYLELTTKKSSSNVEQDKSSIETKGLEQLTLNELKDLCRHYHLPCSHANKSQLIQRISTFRNSQSDDSTTTTTNEFESINSIDLDEILRSFPPSTTLTDDDENQLFDQFFSQLVDPQSISNHQDDLFVQMLLDSSSPSEQIFDDFLVSTDRSATSPLPRITTLDEFDAFLRDFTTYPTSNSFQQISTSTN